MKELHVTLEGRTYLCLKKETVGVPDGSGSAALPGLVVTYSFDKGETWESTQIEAWKSASESGKLVRVDEVAGESDVNEYEAFVLGLLREIQDMEAGESLKVIKGDDTVVVLKGQLVLAVRASAIEDVDLRMEDPS